MGYGVSGGILYNDQITEVRVGVGLVGMWVWGCN